MLTIYYSTAGDIQRRPILISETITLKRPRESVQVAERCAEHYYYNYGGEATWPREFTVYDSADGPAIFSTEVNYELEPTFTAKWPI
jgi:hypothetical protein